MMYKSLGNILTLITLFLLLSCSSNQEQQDTLSGDILLWHSWDGNEAEVLNELLDRFSSIYREVTIIRASMSPDELSERFISSAESGFGPDMLIAPAEMARDLADAGLILDLQDLNQDLNEQEIDRSRYLSAALNTLTEQDLSQETKDRLYGLPFSLSTTALYYNKKMVQSPPLTLEALLEQANEGQEVALRTDFEGGFWGIQAFGGQLFDEQGRILLNQGGFANWLGWLKNAQRVPNITLSNNQETLQTLFAAGEVAYYVGNSTELKVLQKALGQDVVGVAALPEGPSDKAGPFMQTEALIFNRASAAAETNLALALANFLTNDEQQTKLALAAFRVPANRRVRIDQRVSPAVFGFVEQSRTAVTVPLPNIRQMSYLIDNGNDVYVRVLEGTNDVTDAALELTKQANARHGFETVVEVVPEFTCEAGTIEVWHSWQKRNDISALNEIKINFKEFCPAIQVNLTKVDRNIISTYIDREEPQDGPDLLLTNTEFFDLMLIKGFLRDISQDVPPKFLQQYIPAAQLAMSHEGKLYGLPESVELMALYYNPDLVTDPPLTLNDLLHQAEPTRQVALPLGFRESYWGVPAFGGKLLDEENRAILDQAGFIEWLTWLQDAHKEPNIIVSSNYASLRAQFAAGEVAYLAGHKSWFDDLQSELGEEGVSVVQLPTGPQGPAGPLLDVQGLLLNPSSDEQQAALALAFAQYITNLESQSLLMQKAKHVPANINVDTTDQPSIAGFLEQAKSATVPPYVEEMNIIWLKGDAFFQQLLENEALDPEEAVKDFTKQVNQANGFEE